MCACLSSLSTDGPVGLHVEHIAHSSHCIVTEQRPLCANSVHEPPLTLTRIASSRFLRSSLPTAFARCWRTCKTETLKCWLNKLAALPTPSSWEETTTECPRRESVRKAHSLRVVVVVHGMEQRVSHPTLRMAPALRPAQMTLWRWRNLHQAWKEDQDQEVCLKWAWTQTTPWYSGAWPRCLFPFIFSLVACARITLAAFGITTHGPNHTFLLLPLQTCHPPFL
jgi:hypothetical protein